MCEDNNEYVCDNSDREIEGICGEYCNDDNVTYPVYGCKLCDVEQQHERKQECYNPLDMADAMDAGELPF